MVRIAKTKEVTETTDLRIASFNIARLVNTGNYENVRLEATVEFPADSDMSLAEAVEIADNELIRNLQTLAAKPMANANEVATFKGRRIV